MRKGYSNQGRLDTQRIDLIPLNLECRDEIIPVLRSLQYLYSKPNVRAQILKLIEDDVNGDSRSDCGREGMDSCSLAVQGNTVLIYDQEYSRGCQNV